jgi:Domain of unknown function (DUF397)
MQDIHNGISAAQLEGATWRKSQRSNSQGACVELARLDSTTVAMRNSRDPRGTALIYPAGAVRAMVAALRSGEFNDLIG